MTSKKCLMAQISSFIGCKNTPYLIFINVQGDEPLISPNDIKEELLKQKK